jgi:hypothetical protein
MRNGTGSCWCLPIRAHRQQVRNLRRRLESRITNHQYSSRVDSCCPVNHCRATFMTVSVVGKEQPVGLLYVDQVVEDSDWFDADVGEDLVQGVDER